MTRSRVIWIDFLVAFCVIIHKANMNSNTANIREPQNDNYNKERLNTEIDEEYLIQLGKVPCCDYTRKKLKMNTYIECVQRV